MTTRLQLVIICLGTLALLYIGNMVRIKKLELKYSLVWFLVVVLVLVFAIFPPLLEGLTELMGISLPVNMLSFLGIAFTLMIIFSQTIVISNLTRREKRLAQEIALLNKRIDDVTKENE